MLNIVLSGILLVISAIISLDIVKTLDGPDMSTPTDPAFKEYVMAFEDTFKQKVMTPIKFGEIKDLKEQTVAVCRFWGNSSKIIEVKPIYWDRLSKEGREELIFHELGHCEFQVFAHNDKHELNHCPTSIMNSYIFSEFEIEQCYIPNKQYYIDELIQEAGIKMAYKFFIHKFLGFPYLGE